MTDYSIGSIAKIRVSSLSFQPANWWVGTFEQVSSGHLEPSSRTARCVVDSISTPSHLRQGIAFSDMPRLSRKAWIVAHCAGTSEPCSESSPPPSFPTGPVLRGGATDHRDGATSFAAYEESDRRRSPNQGPSRFRHWCLDPRLQSQGKERRSRRAQRGYCSCMDQRKCANR